jgi:ABC-type multidrug transport system ATPase subunit
MNPQETRDAEELITRMRDSGLAMLVIEHDMRFIFSLCDRVLCLVRGEVLVEGTCRAGAERSPGHRGLHRSPESTTRRPSGAAAPTTCAVKPVLEFPPNAINPIVSDTKREGGDA